MVLRPMLRKGASQRRTLASTKSTFYLLISGFITLSLILYSFQNYNYQFGRRLDDREASKETTEVLGMVEELNSTWPRIEDEGQTTLLNFREEIGGNHDSTAVRRISQKPIIDKESLVLLSKSYDIVDGEMGFLNLSLNSNDIVDGDKGRKKLPTKSNDIVDEDKGLLKLPSKGNDIVDGDKGLLKLPSKGNIIIDGDKGLLKLPSKGNVIVDGVMGIQKLSSEGNEIAHEDKGLQRLAKLPANNNESVNGGGDNRDVVRFRLTPRSASENSNCHSNPPFLLVFVMSSPANFERRDVIRKMWLNRRTSLTTRARVRLLFVLGRDGDEDDDVRFESRAYDDVIQTEQSDVYANLVHKVYAALYWTAENCVARDVSYVLKLDDDVFVDVLALVTYLLDFDATKKRNDDVTPSPANTEAEFHCYFLEKFKPYRNGKYAVTREEYKLDVYPSFCTGPAYVMTGWTAASLLSITRVMGEQFFRLEDVFFTGILGDRLGARFVRLNSRYVPPSKTEEEFLTAHPGRFLFYHPHPSTRYNFKTWLVIHRKLFARYQTWNDGVS